MSRVILFSGKGGVGKTSVAAATGLSIAREGRKTLVVSFDFAHSLHDSFDIEKEIFSRHQGQPVTVEPNLDIQEIDLQEEMQRQWGDTYKVVTGLVYGGGSLQGVLAEEVGVMPGMEDLVALNCLYEWLERGTYDVIVVDCPPTAEALGFVGFASILQYYVRKRLPFDRKVSKMVRPIALTIDASLEMFLPEDRHFTVLERVAERMARLDEILRNPAQTSIRLVTNPEKMVMLETKRALMYFSMYGITVDAVVINRVFPESGDYFAKRVAHQEKYLAEMRSDFEPLPVFTVPWMRREIAGVSALADFGGAIYGDRRPSDVFNDTPPMEIVKESAKSYRLEVKLPFVEKDQIDIRRSGQDLGIRIGPFKRNVELPRALASLSTGDASFRGDRLVVHFGESRNEKARKRPSKKSRDSMAATGAAIG